MWAIVRQLTHITDSRVPSDADNQAEVAEALRDHKLVLAVDQKFERRTPMKMKPIYLNHRDSKTEILVDNFGAECKVLRVQPYPPS